MSGLCPEDIFGTTQPFVTKPFVYFIVAFFFLPPPPPLSFLVFLSFVRSFFRGGWGCGGYIGAWVFCIADILSHAFGILRMGIAGPFPRRKLGAREPCYQSTDEFLMLVVFFLFVYIILRGQSVRACVRACVCVCWFVFLLFC